MNIYNCNIDKFYNSLVRATLAKIYEKILVSFYWVLQSSFLAPLEGSLKSFSVCLGAKFLEWNISCTSHKLSIHTINVYCSGIHSMFRGFWVSNYSLILIFWFCSAPSALLPYHSGYSCITFSIRKGGWWTVVKYLSRTSWKSSVGVTLVLAPSTAALCLINACQKNTCKRSLISASCDISVSKCC